MYLPDDDLIQIVPRISDTGLKPSCELAWPGKAQRTKVEADDERLKVRYYPFGPLRNLFSDLYFL